MRVEHHIKNIGFCGTWHFTCDFIWFLIIRINKHFKVVFFHPDVGQAKHVEIRWVIDVSELLSTHGNNVLKVIDEHGDRGDG